MNHLEGGQKITINMTVRITAVHWLAFHIGTVVLSVACILGGAWVILTKEIQVLEASFLKL